MNWGGKGACELGGGGKGAPLTFIGFHNIKTLKYISVLYLPASMGMLSNTC